MMNDFCICGGFIGNEEKNEDYYRGCTCKETKTNKKTKTDKKTELTQSEYYLIVIAMQERVVELRKNYEKYEHATRDTLNCNSQLLSKLWKLILELERDYFD